MLRLAALAVLLTAPAVGAQTFVRADGSDLGPTVRVGPQAAFQSLGLLDGVGELEGYALAVRGGDGRLTVIAHELPRQPNIEPENAVAVWKRASVGCGTACFWVWYADPDAGIVSPAIGSPLYEDPLQRWVLVPSLVGVQIVDPLDPSWAWELSILPESPLLAAVAHLVVDVEVSPSGMLTLSADGVPGVIRAQVPERD